MFTIISTVFTIIYTVHSNQKFHLNSLYLFDLLRWKCTDAVV